MNKAILVGNLTKDPVLRTTGSGLPVCSFTVACNRRFKGPDGAYGVDYIDCVAWRQTADFVCKYFGKGKPIGVDGSIQTRRYEDKNGVTRYVTEVVVDKAEFVGPKGNQAQRRQLPSWYGDDTGETTMNEHFAQQEGDVFAGDIDPDFVPLSDAELPF